VEREKQNNVQNNKVIMLEIIIFGNKRDNKGIKGKMVEEAEDDGRIRSKKKQ